MRVRLSLRRAGPLVLMAIALAALVAQGDSAPHPHPTWQPGFYNQEHDLSALAAFGTVAPPPAVTAVGWFVFVVGALPVAAVAAPASLPFRHADSRAPPAR